MTASSGQPARELLSLKPLFRRLTFMAMLLGAAGATCMGVLRYLDATKVTYGKVGLALSINMQTKLARLAKSRATGNPRVAFLGDSTVFACPQGKWVTNHLSVILRTRTHRKFMVFSLVAAGMSSFEYYAFSESIAKARPDQVVLAFNFASFSQRWRDRWDRLETVGWIPPGGVVEAMYLPLYSWGMTFDRLLLYVALVQFGQTENWYTYRREQVRVDRGLQQLRRWMQGAPRLSGDGLPPVPPEGDGKNLRRFGVERLRCRYGEAIEGVGRKHPVLRLLGAALDVFRRAGIPTLVYIVPTNVEHLAKVGVGPPDGLENSVMTLRRLVEDRGASFLDLHRLLPDAGFRDADGHFACKGKINGPKLVATRLAQAILSRGQAASFPSRRGGL